MWSFSELLLLKNPKFAKKNVVPSIMQNQCNKEMYTGEVLTSEQYCLNDFFKHEAKVKQHVNWYISYNRFAETAY